MRIECGKIASQNGSQSNLKITSDFLLVSHFEPLKSLEFDMNKPVDLKIKSITPHPMCKLFPPASWEDFEALKASIKEFGYNYDNPIVTWQGYILDGANRQRACEELGIPPYYTPYFGTDPLGYVIQMNVPRRHLSVAQRAVLAAELEKLQVGEHKLSTKSVTGVPLIVPFNVNPTSLSIAKRLVSDSPDLAAQVKQGGLSLNAAEAVATLPKKHQAQVVKRGLASIKFEAKKIRKKKSEVKFTPDPNYVPPAEQTEREKLIASESVPKVEQAPTASLPDRTPVAGSQGPKKAPSVEHVAKMHDPFAPADRLPQFATWFRSWWAAKTNPYGATIAPARGAKEVFEVVDQKLKEAGL